MRKNSIEIKVRGYHLDLYRHVNNARYLEFLEEARWAYFEGVLSDEVLHQQHLAFVIANINISYRNPAYLHDTLIVTTSRKETGKRKIIMYQEITDKASEKIVAFADVTFVLVDTLTGSAIELRDDILEILFPGENN